MEPIKHYSVMPEEVLDGLAITPEGVYWDGTFGGGGHSALILARLGEDGRLFGSDRDAVAKANAARVEDSRFTFIRGSLEEAVTRVPIDLAGFVWDLGCSTMQLKNPERGFSFREGGPLDMRMDPDQPESAEDLVNGMEEEDLANLIYKYGEERFSRRIAARIVARRREQRITDTETLASICRGVYPRNRRHRIDPATRTFQALRIAVNDELGQLERTLTPALDRLRGGGRAVIISFHSLEDRIVKHCFRDLARGGPYKVITKKPLVPNEEETRENPASRSAKLRVLERVA